MIQTKKVDKSLSDLLFKLTESESCGLVKIPEDWEVLENNESEFVCCSCGEFSKIKYFPYAYDKKNNEVYYVGLCPKCGDYIYFCD